MDSGARKKKADSNLSPVTNRANTLRLFWEYTLLFALFFIVVFSPFWFYGKSLLWGSDGTSQHIAQLTYARHWLREILNNFRSGKPEIPFWSLWIGFGQNTIGTTVSYRLADLFFALLPQNLLEPYMWIRTALFLYIAGLTFILYARTYVKKRIALLMGSLLYTFSGFTLFFVPRHFFFLDLLIAFPLILLGVDQIFNGRWSWLFIFTVAWEGLHGFYLLFMITIPAVIYALFLFFEPTARTGVQRGSFGRILLRHVVQYAIGLSIGAVNHFPILLYAFDSSRVSAQKGVNLLYWNSETYTNFIRSIVDMEGIGTQGYISLSGIALIGIVHLLYFPRKNRRLLLSQLILYTLAFLVPVLTMVFSGFAGKTQRWCFIYSFWTSLITACALPGLLKGDGQGHRFCLNAFLIYVVIYLAATIWSVRNVSITLVLTMVVVVLLLTMVFSQWGRQHRKAAAFIMFGLVLIELTAKSYTLFSPQYKNYISSFIDAGRVLPIASDNASDAIEITDDDGLFRTDVVTLPLADKELQTNYGARNHVNGISSYYSYNSAEMADYSLDLGNSQQKTPFKTMDLDQRTVLDELAAVKYVAVLDNGVNRIPYGYEQVGSREKTLSDGTTGTEYLYRNTYALPLSYAYDSWISRQDYDALPVNRREQAMLQGVVLETEAPLKRAELAFDDRVVLDRDVLMDALKKAAGKNNKLEITEDGVIRVSGRNCSVTIPIEETEGEIYLLLENAGYESVNFMQEEASRLIQEGASRISIINAKRKARAWSPEKDSLLTATSGELSGNASLQGVNVQYYIGNRSYLMNLGCGRTGSKLKINFTEAGEYRFDRIALIAQPMDTYAQKVAPLLERQAESVAVDGNTVTVEYDLDKDAFACLAIPYSKSWSATIDGEEAQILPANGMYMGVMLDQGRHTIVFHYVMRGFREGAAVSAATLLGLIIFAIVRRIRRYGRQP